MLGLFSLQPSNGAGAFVGEAVYFPRDANSLPYNCPLVSWREHVIFASLQDRTFGAAAQELNDDRIF
jgi:hypothetical protein